MGLPGSGKSYFSRILAPVLNGVWLNADKVRKDADDWDFTLEGRKRQARRMAKLSEDVLLGGNHVIADFICPTRETREIFSPDYIIFMNTIISGKYGDTNALFEIPENVDFEINEKNAELICYIVANKIEKYIWNNKFPTAQMLGRYQPWHAGHRKLFEEILKKTGQVLVMVRDVNGVGDNPFDFESVKAKIELELIDYGDRAKIVLVPNITDICYGRDVGYNIEKINLSPNIKKISATGIRSEMRKTGKIK